LIDYVYEKGLIQSYEKRNEEENFIQTKEFQ